MGGELMAAAWALTLAGERVLAVRPFTHELEGVRCRVLSSSRSRHLRRCWGHYTVVHLELADGRRVTAPAGRFATEAKSLPLEVLAEA
jgi:hypothetical protein